MTVRGALALAVVAALAATVASALHAPATVLAWLAALAAFAFAVAAGAAALALDARDDLREPRHERGPSHPEPLPPDAVSRGVFGRMWAYAAGAIAIMAAVPFVALARRPAPRGTAWSRGARLVDPDGRPMRADDVAVGGVETVFPEGNVGAPESATLLLRLQDDALRTQPGREGWAPHGNVAYSKICTHAGCPVAIYRHQSYQLYCPCHQSVFDVLNAARPISGPATRALPQLALDVDADGYLVARGDYTEPVGPDDWWRTI
jgi:ubiquinol-cytochrome c reductase iron-sulfur subunit